MDNLKDMKDEVLVVTNASDGTGNRHERYITKGDGNP